MLANYQRLFGSISKECIIPLDPNDHPELDTSPELDKEGKASYVSPIGCVLGAVLCWSLCWVLSWVLEVWHSAGGWWLELIVRCALGVVLG
jgi:hypothetical protein